MKLDSQGGEYNTICVYLQSVDPCLVGFSKHNQDQTKGKVRKIINKVTGQYFDHAQVNMAGTPILTATNFKPGGVMAMVIGPMKGRVQSIELNSMGRWVHYTTLGKYKKTIHFIFAYQVVARSEASALKSHNTVFLQQMVILRQPYQSGNTNPRYHFQADLKELIKKIDEKKEECLVVGDFNEKLGSDQHGIIKIVQAFGLVDLMEDHMGMTNVSTYARGMKQLNYAIRSHRLLECIHRVGYEPFGCIGDHHVLYLYYWMEKLFGNVSPPLAPMEL